MIARLCPVCKTGEIVARGPASLARRACCSRPCALAIAREVKLSRLPSPEERAAAEAARLVERERVRQELIALVDVAPLRAGDLGIQAVHALKRDTMAARTAVRSGASTGRMQRLINNIRADLGTPCPSQS